jgi:hypothetical protein
LEELEEKWGKEYRAIIRLWRSAWNEFSGLGPHCQDEAFGETLGTLSTLGLSVPAINGVGDLGREPAYARAHSGIAGLTLVLGTESFDPSRLEGCVQNLAPNPAKLPTPDDLSRTLECTGQR